MDKNDWEWWKDPRFEPNEDGTPKPWPKFREFSKELLVYWEAGHTTDWDLIDRQCISDGWRETWRFLKDGEWAYAKNEFLSLVYNIKYYIRAKIQVFMGGLHPMQIQDLKEDYKDYEEYVEDEFDV